MEPLPLGPLRRSAAADEPLDLVVADIFRIAGRGTITTGRIRAGVLRQGDVVEVVRPDGEALRVNVRGIDFLCGPNVRQDDIAFLLDPHPDDFVVAGTVIRGVAKE